MRLRVLACAFACNPFGTSQLGSGEEVLGWNLAKQLARFHDLHVLTLERNRPYIELWLRDAPDPNVTFHYLDLKPVEFLLRFQGLFQVYVYLWQIASYRAARRLHRQYKFDVFHHLTYANDWLASYIGAFLGVPYLRGPGGGAQKTPPQFLSEYALQNRLWERYRANMGWVLRHDPVFLLSQSRARRILVCNRESLAALPQRFQHKATLFPVNGISAEDMTILAARRNAGDDQKSGGRETGGRFRVLAAGRLIALKGWRLAIRAFHLFAARHKEAEMLIAGDGPDLEPLRDLVHALDLGQQVRFAGFVARKDLLGEMGSCDVFLFPSFRDGGGAVVVEAMAAGRPVICMDLAGPGMHVTDDCGIKIPARSPQETVELMAQALERLHADRELSARMGQAARARAQQVYSWDHLGDRLQAIYTEVLMPAAREV
jgi:glycosyltransferase involved in cell wall biosynthesis